MPKPNAIRTWNYRDFVGQMRAGLVFLIVACGVLSSCWSGDNQPKSPYPPGYFDEQIASLRQADVAQDVAKALDAGDGRFLLNIGFAGNVPGVPEWSSQMREKYGVRILDGTGDLVFGPKHEEFKRIANEYATKYNRLMLEHVSKKEEPQTQSLERTPK